MRPQSNRTTEAMKRIFILAGMLGLALTLSACDKCGNFGPFFGMSDKSCGGQQTN